MATGNRTSPIYKATETGDAMLGYVGSDGIIYKLRWQEGVPIGRCDKAGRIYRNTARGERDLGHVSPDGQIFSNGLFEGGALGWLDTDGIVVQGGLILGEEDVGHVEGPLAHAAAAALLLIFLPDDAEASRKMEG